jgi:hypothetical protein
MRRLLFRRLPSSPLWAWGIYTAVMPLKLLVWGARNQHARDVGVRAASYSFEL